MAIANLPSNVPAIMVKEMLDRAPAFRRIGVAFDNIKIGKQSGASIIRTRWINGAISVTPEPQGQNPTTQALTAESYTATMQRYSAAYATSRYNDDLNPLDWAKGQSDVLMTEVESTRERLQYNAALSGTNVIYNSAAITTRQTVNGVITLGRLQKAVASIEAAKGMTFTSESGGSTKVGTAPTEAGFYCFVHTDAHPDIRNLPGFTKKAEMTGGNYPPGTFGCVDNIVFVTSPEFVPFLGAATSVSNAALRSTGGFPDVYPFVLCAKGALSGVSLGGSGKAGFGNVEVFTLDKADKSDITNSRLVVSAAWYDCPMLVSYDWLVRIECGVTANPA
jgi:N4-gp56 family major capsid protein